MAPRRERARLCQFVQNEALHHLRSPTDVIRPLLLAPQRPTLQVRDRRLVRLCASGDLHAIDLWVPPLLHRLQVAPRLGGGGGAAAVAHFNADRVLHVAG